MTRLCFPDEVMIMLWLHWMFGVWLILFSFFVACGIVNEMGYILPYLLLQVCSRCYSLYTILVAVSIMVQL